MNRFTPQIIKDALLNETQIKLFKVGTVRQRYEDETGYVIYWTKGNQILIEEMKIKKPYV